MKEAFDTMGNHPLLTLFLGLILVAAIEAIVKPFLKRKR